MEITLFPQQQAVLDCSSRFSAAICGIQSGKTTTGSMWLLKQIFQNPKDDFLLAAPCYSDDTEILTEKRGWVLFKDLVDSDRVATLVKDKIKFVTPSERYEWDFDGEMVGMKHSQIDLLVTPNHRMYFRHTYQDNWQVKTAEEIYGKRIKLRRHGLFNGPKKKPDWYEFLGFWFAEGCALFDKKHGSRVIITQKGNEDYVKDLLKKNSLFYHRNKNGDKWNYVIYDKKLCSELSQYGKALIKFVPYSIKKADPESLRAFLYGYWMGDGRKIKSQTLLYTFSKRLADDLQEMANRCGEAATVRGHKYLAWKNKGYTVSILKHYGREPVVDKDHYYRQPYKGKVYCVKIGEGEGILFVRRNGMSVWSLNTYKILEQSTLRKFFEIFPLHSAVYRKQDSVLELINGGKIYIRSTEIPNNIEGMTVRAAWLDEGGMMKPQVWVNALGRVAIKQGKILITSTPYNMGWLYREVVRQAQSKNPEYSIFNWSSADNPYFPKDEYEKAKLRLSKSEFDRRYNGVFHKPEGLVYPDFDAELMTEISAPSDKEVKEAFCGVDYGFSNPTAIIPVLLTKDDRVHVVDETYETRLTVPEIVERCREMKEKWNISMFYVDPTSPGLVEALNLASLPAMPANNDVESGISRVRQLMKGRRLRIWFAAYNLLDEIENYQYAVSNSMVGDSSAEYRSKPDKSFDHAVDALRYAIATHPLDIYSTIENPVEERKHRFWENIYNRLEKRKMNIERYGQDYSDEDADIIASLTGY